MGMAEKNEVWLVGEATFTFVKHIEVDPDVAKQLEDQFPDGTELHLAFAKLIDSGAIGIGDLDPDSAKLFELEIGESDSTDSEAANA
jgi:hypothetical protein